MLCNDIHKLIWQKCDFADIVKFSSVNKQFHKEIKGIFVKNAQSLQFWKNYKYPCQWLFKKIDEKIKQVDFMKIVRQIEKIFKNEKKSISKKKRQAFLTIFEKHPEWAIEHYFHLFPPEIFKLNRNFSLSLYIAHRGSLMTPQDMEYLIKEFVFDKDHLKLALRNNPPEVIHTLLTHLNINLNLFDSILVFHNKRSKKLLPIVINYYEEKNNIIPKLMDINFYKFQFYNITIEHTLLKEMYKRGCLDSYLDKFRYMESSYLERILNLDLDIKHVLFNFAKNICKGKSVDMPYGYLIPDNIFKLAIQKKVDNQVIRNMLEFNLKQKLSSDQIDFFYKYFSWGYGMSLFDTENNLPITYFLQHNLNKFIQKFNKILKSQRNINNAPYFINYIRKYLPDFINREGLIPKREIDLEWKELWQEKEHTSLPTSSKDVENHSLSEGQELLRGFEKTSPFYERSLNAPKRHEDKRAVEDELPNSHSEDDKYSWLEDVTVNTEDFLEITNRKRKRRQDQNEGKKYPKL